MTANGRRGADTRLIAALASGATMADAARQAGIGERTAYRRLDDPLFAAKVSAARSELLSRAVGQLADGADAAVSTLRALLIADSPQVRVRAARAILELGPRLREATELADRIAELETQFAAQQARTAVDMQDRDNP